MKNVFARLLIAVLLASVPLAHALANPEVTLALSEWVMAVKSGKPENVVALYDKDAIFFSTFATSPLRTQAERLGYYKKVMDNPDINIEVTESHPVVFGDVAINSGLYTFSYTQDGEPVVIKARFSFAYILRGGKWIIVDHHSSKAPGSEIDNKLN